MDAGPRRRIPIVLPLIATAILLLVLLWDWNWFRPLIERQASAALGRPVSLRHFDLRLGWQPMVIADGIAVANPPEFPEGTQLGSVDRLAVRVDPWDYFEGRLRIVSIEIDRPVGDLRPGPSGKPNYVFDALAQREPPQADAKPLAVDIGRLSIRDGDVHIVEPGVKADFRLRIRTLDAQDGDEPKIRVDADGKYANAPITGRFIGGSVLGLRDPARPYPVDLQVKNGDTEVALVGTLIEPLSFGGARLKLDFKGNNLADLFPLTGVPLPPSPPYRLTGRFDYADGRFRFNDFTGTYGQSDIAGDVSVLPARGGRRQVTMVAHSSKVVWADLAGFLGGTPGETKAANDTAEQDAERARKKASGKLLPDTPISLPRIRAADLDVSYKVDRIESDIAPVDRLEGHLVMEDGLIRVRPLKLGVGSGSIAANIELDGRKDLIHTSADIDFRKLDFSKIMKKMSAFNGTGTIGGNAQLDTHGNSLAAMLGSGNGGLRLFMAGGDISAILVNLAGLDFGNVLVSALGIPRRADLRCMVVDMGLQQGQLGTKLMLVDTTEANIIGTGNVDLANENIDYKLRTEPKRFNVGSLAAPIDITGKLASPSIRPQLGSLAARGGGAVLLGTLFTPLAALLPTIQLGLGEDNDCSALLKNVEASAQGAKAKAPPAPPDPARGREREGR